MAVFPIFYTGSIGYYQALLRADKVEFELHEHFVKQTQRNRTTILGPNGPQLLVIPTQKANTKRYAGTTRISYAENWQKEHWKSLEAAYRRSPYFEFYEHEFISFYRTETQLLVDFNLELMIVILRLLNIEMGYTFTKEFRTESEDFRNSPFALLNPCPYMQVFNDRQPFIPNLSILDALFNLGPKAIDILKV